MGTLRLYDNAFEPCRCRVPRLYSSSTRRQRQGCTIAKGYLGWSAKNAQQLLRPRRQKLSSSNIFRLAQFHSATPLIARGFARQRNMAQKARKDRAKSNSAALNNLHIGSLIVNGLFLLLHLVFRTRSLLLWFILSLPSFACQFALERTGRPSYDPTTKALKSSGEDLGAAGLTEYMFDVIWVTWGAAILVALLGNWAWLLWAVVPAYGVYKGFGMMGAAKQMAQMGADANPAPAGNRKQRRAA